MILIFYRGTGILVVVYTIFCFFGTALILGSLQRNFGGIFNSIGMSGGMAIGALLAGALTYWTKDDYYKDRNGVRKKTDARNELFFLSMHVWSFILFGLSILLFLNAAFHFM